MRRTKQSKVLGTKADDVTEQVTTLHNRIMGNLRRSLEDAIKIGELLTQKKKELRHGEWGPWVRDNLPFSDQTARNYRKLYQHQEELKSKNVLDLSDAYKLVSSRGDKQQIGGKQSEEDSPTEVPEVYHFVCPKPSDLAGYYTFLLKLGYSGQEAVEKMAFKKGENDPRYIEITQDRLDRFLDPEPPKFRCYLENVLADYQEKPRDEQEDAQKWADFLEDIYSAHMRVNLNWWFAGIHERAANYADIFNYKELEKEFQAIANHYEERVKKDQEKYGPLPLLNLYLSLLDEEDVDKNTKIACGIGVFSLIEDDFFEGIGLERETQVEDWIDFNWKLGIYWKAAKQYMEQREDQ